jgi:LysM repeat protein
MECPVCKTSGLAPDLKICPHCSSDLEGFGYIKRLSKTLKTVFWSLIAASLLLLFFILAWIFIPLKVHPSQATGEMEVVKKQLQEQMAANKQLQLTVSNLESEKLKTDSILRVITNELAEVKSSKGNIISGKGEYTEYTVERGETLYLIAQEAYGDGKLYLRLAKDNEIKDPDMILEGQKLKIYK